MTGLLERLGLRAPAARRCLPRDVEISADTTPLGGTARWWWCSNCDRGGYVIDQPRRAVVDAARRHLAGHPVCRPRVHPAPRGGWAHVGVGRWLFGATPWTFTCDAHPEVTGPRGGDGWLTFVGPGSANQAARHHALAHEAPREVA